jgi:hypothetical protein
MRGAPLLKKWTKQARNVLCEHTDKSKLIAKHKRWLVLRLIKQA